MLSREQLKDLVAPLKPMIADEITWLSYECIGSHQSYHRLLLWDAIQALKNLTATLDKLTKTRRMSCHTLAKLTAEMAALTATFEQLLTNSNRQLLEEPKAVISTLQNLVATIQKEGQLITQKAFLSHSEKLIQALDCALSSQAINAKEIATCITLKALLIEERQAIYERKKSIENHHGQQNDNAIYLPSKILEKKLQLADAKKMIDKFDLLKDSLSPQTLSFWQKLKQLLFGIIPKTNAVAKAIAPHSLHFLRFFVSSCIDQIPSHQLSPPLGNRAAMPT